MNLEYDVHVGLSFPSNSTKHALVRGRLVYYHYKCDEVDDVNWGCGYRTLQTLCSWIKHQENVSGTDRISFEVPTILDLQKALVKIGDKDDSFIGSRQWIGSVEVAYCIDHFYKIQCRILHCRHVKDLESSARSIMDHFQDCGSPIMMGGDRDCSSKGILGICESEDGIYLLILDPHYHGSRASKAKLQSEGWIKWQKIDDLDHSSFYNLCCPLIKAVT